MIPTDELIFSRGVGIPPTSHSCYTLDSLDELCFTKLNKFSYLGMIPFTFTNHAMGQLDAPARFSRFDHTNQLEREIAAWLGIMQCGSPLKHYVRRVVKPTNYRYLP